MGMQAYGLHEAQMAQHNLEAKAHFERYGLHQWQESLLLNQWQESLPPAAPAPSSLFDFWMNVVVIGAMSSFIRRQSVEDDAKNSELL